MSDDPIHVLTCANDIQKYTSCVLATIAMDNRVKVFLQSNVSEKWTVTQALNRLIDSVQDEDAILVCCHQDILFPDGWIDKLFGQIEEIEIRVGRDGWGVLGTAGMTVNGAWVGNIVDPHRTPPSECLPFPVQTLDENCLIFRKSSGLRFDDRTCQYHLYGTDLCLIAKMKGLMNYAIDAQVVHLSGGRVDERWKETANKIVEKWASLLQENVIHTTCGSLGFTPMLVDALGLPLYTN